MSFVVLAIISSLSWLLLLWIGKGWLLLVPTFFLIIYAIDRINHLWIKKINPRITVEHGILISRCVIMIGISLLMNSQQIGWQSLWLWLVATNTFLLFLSYYNNYQEGKSIFFWGLPLSWIISISIWIINHHIDRTYAMVILTIATVQCIIVLYIIHKYLTTNDNDNNQLYQSKEIVMYILLYLCCYRLLLWNNASIIVLQLRSVTVLISLRQQFLSYQSHIQHEKQIWLTGRAILQGQKVLKRYESKKDTTYSIMNNAISLGIVPSKKWLEFLQLSQWILIVSLIAISVWSLWHNNVQILLRYRLGVLCFVISIFTLDRQDKFFNRYKKLWIIILSSAFYLTLFYKTQINGSFIIASLWRNCINMLCCLFYDTLVPLQKRILNRHDLIFWMLRTNWTSIITLLSLWWLNLSGDIIFALGCIIVGMISFFSYHIWRKYHTNNNNINL